MWKKIQDKDYFLSVHQNNDYEICVTDFISIWTASFSEKAFIAQLKNSNEGLLLESNKEYIDNGLYLLNSGIDTLKHSRLEESGDNLLITMRTVIDLYPFGFECKLCKGSNEFFCKKVTQPLLETVSDLKSSEDDLLQELTKKEKEIKAYKRELENKEIIFRHEVSKSFCAAQHRKTYRMYDKVFGSQNIIKSILLESAKMQQIPQAQSLNTDISDIKREPNNIKQEQNNIKQELHCIKQEQPITTQEPNNIKEEPREIKQEPSTSVFDNHNTPLITQPSSCKQDMVEPETSGRRSNRKKLKLSY